MLTFLSKRILSSRLHALASSIETYKSVSNPSQIRAIQLAKFNDVWRKAYKRYTFYKLWKKKHDLPDQAASLEELSQFPVLRKSDLRACLEWIEQEVSSCEWVTTGGSTGEPFRFPISQQDSDLFYVNTYTGRSWWGLKPLDRIVMIWGHSHLFGQGRLSRIKCLERSFRDYLINTKRLNAYRLNSDNLRFYHHAIMRESNAAIISYTSAFRKMLDYIEDSQNRPIPASVKWIILTAETVDERDKERVRRLFDLEPIVEYGMAECGVIAYSDPETHDLRFLWDSFLCQVQEGELVLSTISDRLFPLIRYGSGDRVKEPDSCDSVLSASSMEGRVNDTIDIPLSSGTMKVHSEIFTHVIKAMPDVQSFLISQMKDNIIKVALLLKAKQPLDSYQREFMNKIKLEFPDIVASKITFEALDEEKKTLAGKHKFILKEDE